MARGQPRPPSNAERQPRQVLAAKLRARNAGLPRGVFARAVAADRNPTALHSPVLLVGPGTVVCLDSSTPPAADQKPAACARDRPFWPRPGGAASRSTRRSFGDGTPGGRPAGFRAARSLPPGSARRLVIVPDGSLHQLNLETLPVPGQPRYLLDDATIVVSPSLAVFAAQRAGPEQPAPLSLLVGAGRPGTLISPAAQCRAGGALHRLPLRGERAGGVARERRHSCRPA